MNYSEKLKDPRWQKKRLEIFERDEFTCRICRNDKETLHAHHRFYQDGVEPWDYPDDVIITLCETCHAEVHTPNRWVIICIEREIQRRNRLREMEAQKRLAEGWQGNFLTLSHSRELLGMALKCCESDGVEAARLRLEFRRALEDAQKMKKEAA
jgi:hypothetical protein